FGVGGGFGPYDRGAAAFKRQNGEWSGRQKMLFGATAMIALVRDIDDDCRLSVTPAVGRDSCPAADRRSRAVGGDEERREQRGSIAELRINTQCSARCARIHRTAFRRKRE